QEPCKSILRSSDLIQRIFQFHLCVATELLYDIKDFGRTPATLEVAGSTLDLRRLTARMPEQLTGTAQFNGKIDIDVNSKIEANLNVTGDSVGFPNGTVEKVSATASVSKIVPPANVKKPWFA